MTVARLEPGMVLSRPIISDKGMLLLPKHHDLTELNIEKLEILEEQMDKKFEVFIKRNILNAGSKNDKSNVDNELIDPDKFLQDVD